MPNASSPSPGSQTGTAGEDPTQYSILHDGPKYALVAVCLNHYQATFEAEVHEDTGLVSLCSCGLNVCAPVQVSVISMPR